MVDELDAIIPNVIIEGKSSKKNTFKTKTDSNGNFEIEVIDGLYKISISHDGFKKIVFKSITTL